MSSKLSSLFNASTCAHFGAHALKILSSCALKFERLSSNELVFRFTSSPGRRKKAGRLMTNKVVARSIKRKEHLFRKGVNEEKIFKFDILSVLYCFPHTADDDR